jgi:Cdc6-like AAA superfamily ATPase
MNNKEFKITIPKIDFLKIVDLLDEFGKLATARGIKFNKYTEEQLLEILYAYRNYRTGDKPPF